MLGLSIIPFKSTLFKISSSKHFLITSEVFKKQSFAEWSPSINTSGSTIGTMPHSWTKAEYRASACALLLIASSLGYFSPIL